MDFAAFVAFLDRNGVDYRDSGNRLLLKECTECGYQKYKTAFRKTDGKFRALYARCFRCDASYSSYRYLVDLGFAPAVVRQLHDFEILSRDKATDFASLLDSEEAADAALIPEYKPKGVSLAGFFKITDWPDHPASKYALRRGVPPALFDDVMIDPEANAVVFLCREGEKICGWQKRFVSPPRPNFKTLNPPGEQFKKSMHVIEYANSGDIVICEGPFTGVAAYAFGFHAFVTFGSSVSPAQLAKIEATAQGAAKKVFVGFDQDPAGFRGYFKIKNYFARRGIDVQRIKPEEGNDLNDALLAGKGAKIVDDDTFDPMVPVLDMFADIYAG